MLTFQPCCILAMFQNIGQQWPVPLFTVGFGSQFSRHPHQPFVIFRNAIVQFPDFPALKSKCHQKPVLHILTKLCLLSSVGMHWCRSNQTLKLLCSALDLQDLLLKLIYVVLYIDSLVYSNTMYFHWSSFSAFNFALHGVNGHPSSVYCIATTASIVYSPLVMLT